MSEVDVALLEAFLNSHDDDHEPAEWFDPERPELFVEWASARAARGAHDPPREVVADAASWIAELTADVASPPDVATARDLRDGLIAMLLAEGDRSHLPQLDTLVQSLPVRLRILEGRVRVEPSTTGPVAVAAAAVLAAQRLAVSGEWPRLRLCRAEDCRWAFFDRSKNRSRVWCDMGGCGSRAKARTYRERRRGA